MDHLDDITLEELQRALEDVEGKKPTKRLLAAIAYKNGVTQTELAEWYDVERRTIYSWLKRLESDSLTQAVTDARRSGRPRKLSDDQRVRFERTVREAPDEAGYDRPAWTPELVQTHLEETYGVEYSLPSCRRLMKEAGLRYEPGRETDRGVPTTGEDDDQEGHREADGQWMQS